MPLLLLLLVLMMACAPSRHGVRLASATDLPGKLESMDRGGASVVAYRKCPIVLVECQGSPASVPASSWAVGVNCVVRQMFVCLKTDTVTGSQLASAAARVAARFLEGP